MTPGEQPTWAAPYRAAPVDTRVALPGSKSLTNRHLVLAALADGDSRVRNRLRSRDTDLMVEALRRLGATITDSDDGTTRIVPAGSSDDPPGGDPVELDCGLAGTVMRFVPAVAAALGRSARFDGDARARERPMGPVIAALRALGVTVVDDGSETLPFTVHGERPVTGGRLDLDASASSQFVSALLLAAPRFADGLDLRHTGASLPSLPHIAMTVTELRRRGAEVRTPEPGRWVVGGGPIAATDVDVEPDLSNAGAFVAAALVTGGTMLVSGWPETTDQAGNAWRDIAVAFGAEVRAEADGLRFTAGSGLPGVQLDMSDIGELAPVVAAVAAFAEEPSDLTGIGHLRGHETDRLRALACEIGRLGGTVHEAPDGLRIVPSPLRPATLHTYADHRMAHAAAVLGLGVRGVRVIDIGTTAKTFPGFAATWERVMG